MLLSFIHSYTVVFHEQYILNLSLGILTQVMGINGLLVELKSITRKSHLRSLSNLRVGIDGHSWLYRGAFSCADDLQNSTKYVSFFKKMVLLLKSNGLQDFIVVFDGLALPMKHDVNEKRSQSKRENLQLAMQAAKVGDTDLAVSYYRKAISITPEMVRIVCASTMQFCLSILLF